MSTKEIQGRLWSTSPKNWARYFEASFLPMYKKVFEHVPVTEDTLLLDDGCGAGLFTYMATQRGAQAIGVDAAAGLLELSRERNPKTSFMEEDLEKLPFRENTFDVVTAFNSLQYAGNFENALAEAKRVLKPGGLLAVGIWDKPEYSEATHILKAIGSLLPPPPPGTPGPFALSEEGKLEGIFAKQGLKVEFHSKVGCPLFYNNLSEGVKSFMSTGPAAAAGNLNKQSVVEGVISKELLAFQLTEGMYHLQNQFLLFIVRK
jgi:SAM-dependent methyltransferase